MSLTVFITGASSGIGEATALRFAAEGFRLILNARRDQKLQALKQEIEARYAVPVLLKPFDVRDRAAVELAVDSLPDDWRNIDVLVNNAGLALGLSQFFEGNPDQWDTMIDTNVKGLLYISRVLAARMIEQGSGHIVNIGSIAGKEVYDKGNVYCASKHAVDALTKAMRLELATKGVKVTGIHPGAVETEFSIVRFDGDVARAKAVYEGFENLVAADIAEAIYWSVSRPAHVNINDLVIMPMAQPVAGVVMRKG
ncbi:MAG: SDR family NAD(P)-dependent oxidoreductase [Bacteroidetes bacterium]|nr:SDR family NAD(P)-dependent oxidoreductase [Bacteroidota bacterium]